VSSYETAHYQARNVLLDDPCLHCGRAGGSRIDGRGWTRRAVHMALRHDVPEEFLREGSRGRLFSVRPEDYIPLCAKCHKGYDTGKIDLWGDLPPPLQ
jgi:hypothetical protein